MTPEQVAQHEARHAAGIALQDAKYAAEMAYREAVAPIKRERDMKIEAAQAAYAKATGRKA